MKRTFVAYFSVGGRTKQLAETLAHMLDAPLFRIEPKIPYTAEDLDWKNPDSRSSVEMKHPENRPEIACTCEAAADCDTLFICFPIWWYTAPTVIHTFLASCDLRGKTVVPIATSGGSGIGRTAEDLRPLCPGADVLNGMVLPAASGEDALSAWVESLSL